MGRDRATRKETHADTETDTFPMNGAEEDKENKNKNDAHLNDKVDSSEDNFFKNNAKNFSRKSSVSITIGLASCDKWHTL